MVFSWSYWENLYFEKDCPIIDSKVFRPTDSALSAFTELFATTSVERLTIYFDDLLNTPHSKNTRRIFCISLMSRRIWAATSSRYTSDEMDQYISQQFRKRIGSYWHIVVLIVGRQVTVNPRPWVKRLVYSILVIRSCSMKSSVNMADHAQYLLLTGISWML